MTLQRRHEPGRLYRWTEGRVRLDRSRSGVRLRRAVQPVRYAPDGPPNLRSCQSKGSLLKSMKMKTVVVSTTLNAAQHKDITILSSGVAEAVAALKAESGKDIWLFGGGVLFRRLLDAGLVDSIELAVSPVLLGGGVPLLPEGRHWPLRLVDCKTMPNSGIVMLKYAAGPEPDAR